MSELQPPPAPAGPADPAAAARAERLAALAGRRSPTASPASGAPTATTPPATASAARSKRRHPAQGARVAALGLSLATTGGLAGLFAMTSASAGDQVQAATIVSSGVTAGTVASNTTSSSTTASNGTTSGNTAASSTVAPDTTPVADAAVAPAADIVVDGGIFHNKWGDVQVRATFAADGTLVDVATLRTPDDRGKSIRINDIAVPRLNAEALSAQSANVDTVSGATYTSVDYRNSLQSAIDAAAQSGLPVAAASA